MSDLVGNVGGLLVGFALGSIPFGYLLVRLTIGGDIRDSGSGNIGATNVARALGAAGGVVTLVLDAAKGAVAVLVASYLGLAMPVAALGAVLGHCFTPWLGGRGGKGVATLLGAFSLVTATATAAAAVTLVVVLAAARMMSLASLCGSLVLVVAAWWVGEARVTVLAAAAAVAVVVWRHRANIARLMSGAEPRLGGSKT